MTRTEEIIQFAHGLRTTYNTKDPFMIAEHFGFAIVREDNCVKDFKAHTLKLANYPTVIVINNSYTDFSQKVLCAHELGHALLHSNIINHFATTVQNAFTNVEYEANLFAVAFLCNEALLNTPLSSMSNYTLKYILDYNIEKK